MSLATLLLVLAFLLFAIDVVLGLAGGSSGRVKLVSLGLALWVLALLVGGRIVFS